MTLLGNVVDVPPLASIDAAFVGGGVLALLCPSALYRTVGERRSLYHRLRE